MKKESNIVTTKKESKVVKCNDCRTTFYGNEAQRHLKKHSQMWHPLSPSASNGHSLKKNNETVGKNKIPCNYCNYNYSRYSQEVVTLQSENDWLTGNLTWTVEQLSAVKDEMEKLKKECQPKMKDMLGGTKESLVEMKGTAKSLTTKVISDEVVFKMGSDSRMLEGTKDSLEDKVTSNSDLVTLQVTLQDQMDQGKEDCKTTGGLEEIVKNYITDEKTEATPVEKMDQERDNGLTKEDTDTGKTKSSNEETVAMPGGVSDQEKEDNRAIDEQEKIDIVKNGMEGDTPTTQPSDNDEKDKMRRKMRSKRKNNKRTHKFYTLRAQREDLQNENEKLKAMLKGSDAVSAELGVLKTDHQKMKTEHEKLTETLSEVRKLARIFKKKSEVAAHELAEAKSQIEAMKSEK